MDEYINPLTDFGFKQFFGKEESKEFLIDFLNQLLAPEEGFEPIKSIKYIKNEIIPRIEEERKIIYDVNCETESGKQFIVEMQKAPQAYFIDRSIFYASRTIVEQGEKGDDWKYNIKPVYIVAFLNFRMEVLGPNVRTDVALCDMDTNKPISDKIRFIYVQLPNFNIEKAEDCHTILDQWYYILKYPQKMNTALFVQQRELFKRLEKVSSLARLSKEERRQYDEDLKVYRDISGAIEYAETKGLNRGREEGRAEGRAEGKQSMIVSMFENGMDLQVIAKIAKTSIENIKNILKL